MLKSVLPATFSQSASSASWSFSDWNLVLVRRDGLGTHWTVATTTAPASSAASAMARASPDQPAEAEQRGDGPCDPGPGRIGLGHNQQSAPRVWPTRRSASFAARQ